MFWAFPLYASFPLRYASWEYAWREKHTHTHCVNYDKKVKKIHKTYGKKQKPKT